MFSSLGNYVDFPEYSSMAVIYRFILNLEVVIRDREMWEMSSSDQCKSLQGGEGGGGEDHFEVKLRSEAFQLKFQFYIFSNKTKIVNESISKKC